jgi:hypothetical protein
VPLLASTLPAGPVFQLSGEVLLLLEASSSHCSFTPERTLFHCDKQAA